MASTSRSFLAVGWRPSDFPYLPTPNSRESPQISSTSSPSSPLVSPKISPKTPPKLRPVSPKLAPNPPRKPPPKSPPPPRDPLLDSPEEEGFREMSPAEAPEMGVDFESGKLGKGGTRGNKGKIG